MVISDDKTITKKKKKDDNDSSKVEKKKLKKDKKQNKLTKKKNENEQIVVNKQQQELSSTMEQHILNSSSQHEQQVEEEEEEKLRSKIFGNNNSNNMKKDCKKKRKYNDSTTYVDTTGSSDNEMTMNDNDNDNNDNNDDDSSKQHKKDKKKKKDNKKEKKKDKKTKKEKSKTKNLQHDHRNDDNTIVDMNIDNSSNKSIIDSSNNDINNNQNSTTHDDSNEVKESTIPESIPLSTLLSKPLSVSSTTILDMYPLEHGARPLVESYASGSSSSSSSTKSISKVLVENDEDQNNNNNVSLVLFYQYVEPIWTTNEYEQILNDMTNIGTYFNITGRMRIAKEGFNCTVSTCTKSNMYLFIKLLRLWKPKLFYNTEFKLTNNLPVKQKFSSLKVLKVIELVHYGLDGYKAPSLQQYSGVHLEPKQYHTKLQESDIIVIDVRNHYETRIGHFNPPITSSSTFTTTSSTSTATSAATTSNNTAADKEDESDTNGTRKANEKEVQQQQQEEHEQEQIISTKYIDPKIRKSTEFPAWLSLDSTKQLLHNKQVLMYCTGGIRCERASSLLQYKLHNDPTMKSINVKGIYQLQGGIDKYFNEYPNGDYWIGKNYVFDKRFTHTPSLVATTNNTTTTENNNNNTNKDNNDDDDDDDDNSEDEKKEEKNDTTNKDQDEGNITNKTTTTTTTIIISTSKCEICYKQWDMYRGKYRCSTCGVPSLICKECIMNDKNKIKKINKKTIRCDLCVEQNIYSKFKLLSSIQRTIDQYEQQSLANNTLYPGKQQHNQQHNQQDDDEEVEQEDYSDYNTNKKQMREKNNNNEHANSNNSKKRQKQQQERNNSSTTNIQKSTRLRISNLYADITEELLCEYITGITHIVWKMDHNNNMFLGVAWIEIDTIDNAVQAVVNQSDTIKNLVLSNTNITTTDNSNNNNNANNTKKKNFPIRIQYDPPDSKDIWPPPNSALY